jgi:chitin disaccharide deacetylase
VRRLIVNADDFGLTAGVNRAIVEAHSKGLVSSTTLMANAPAFEGAVQLISRSNLSVGCHIVLIDGMPVSTPNEVSSLLSATRTPEFETSFGSFAMRALRGRINPKQVEKEAAGQIGRLQAAGVSVSHVDTHKHAHILPQILQPVVRAAKACGIRAIRNPFGRIAFSAVASRPALWKRYSQLKVLNGLAGRFRRTVEAEGIITPDGSLGVAATGALDERLFELIVENLPEGTWEFVTHPGYNDHDLDGVRTRLRESRETELKLLTSTAAREALERAGIELISYRELTG